MIRDPMARREGSAPSCTWYCFRPRATAAEWAPAEETGPAPAADARQRSPGAGSIFEGIPAVWGDTDQKGTPPYELARVSADCSSGVTLRLKYKRVGEVEPLLLDLSSLSVYVHFFSGVQKLDDLPAFPGGSPSWPCEVRRWRGGAWNHIGHAIAGGDASPASGAVCLVVPPADGRFPPEAGEVVVPLIGSEAIPLFGDGMAVVRLGYLGRAKGAQGLSVRTLSNAMVVRLHLLNDPRQPDEAAPGVPDRSTDEAEARVVKELGGLTVESLTLSAENASWDELAEAMTETKPAITDLSTVIPACRQHAECLPAVAHLRTGMAASDVTKTLGVFSVRTPGTYKDGMRVVNVIWYTYGGLDVGVDDGVIVAVRVRSTDKQSGG